MRDLDYLYLGLLDGRNDGIAEQDLHHNVRGMTYEVLDAWLQRAEQHGWIGRDRSVRRRSFPRWFITAKGQAHRDRITLTGQEPG